MSTSSQQKDMCSFPRIDDYVPEYTPNPDDFVFNHDTINTPLIVEDKLPTTHIPSRSLNNNFTTSSNILNYSFSHCVQKISRDSSVGKF
ncbi:unnamed protein product [Rhizophagus irregularis]|nr:unnamed protein product [Rhizophagus irregularis]